MSYSTLRPTEADQYFEQAIRIHKVVCVRNCPSGLTWAWYEDIKFMFENGLTEQEIIDFYTK